MQGEVTVTGNAGSATVRNVLTTAGKEYIAQALGGGASYAGEYAQIGTGDTAQSTADTDLESPVGGRIQGSLSASGVEFTLDSTIPAGTPATEVAVTEAGLFSAATDGVLIARTTFPVVTKQPTDSIRLQWKITVN
jgi:hypothetical protein